MIRVLWVDDDPLFLKLINGIFKKDEGLVELRTCTSAQEAMELMQSEPADLLFTDLMMPNTSGMELLAQVRHLHPSTEIIVVTGLPSVDSAVQAMKAGAFDFITKPINADLVREKIATFTSVLSCKRQMEDFRYAKEMIESGAKHSIGSMEIKLDCYLKSLESICRVLHSEMTSDEKIDKISSILTSCGDVSQA